jgi:hypothetical protein
MFLTPYDDFFRKHPGIFAGGIIYPLWIWLAVRTTGALRILTRHTIPIPIRTIWLTKTLALVVGAGGVFTLSVDFGLPWYLAFLPAGIVVFFALRENVEAIVSPVPPQTETAYRSSWEKYRHLRANVRRWLIAFGIVIVVGMVVVGAVESISGQNLQNVFLIGWGIAMIGCWAGIGFTHFKLQRWPCPRCGNSYRGFWGRPFLPRKCCYCGLPRWQDNPSGKT